jgi:hypothetical protein
MPNWVFNSMVVNGSKSDLVAFRDKARKLSPHGITEDGVLEYKDENASEISFWNFIEPENKSAYFGASDYKPEGYDKLSSEEQFAITMKHESDGWYDWNVRNWGTKWDACDTSLDDNTEGKGPFLNYNFQTAWSIPEAVFTAIVSQHPELSFDFSCEEEQGWGAEFTSSDADDVGEDGKPTKSLIMTREWDIPDSHQDYVDRDRECWACDNGDPDELYADCPREVKDFVVVVERRYIVKAETAEKAWEIAQDTLDDLEPEDLDTIRVLDENTGQLLFPTTSTVE